MSNSEGGSRPRGVVVALPRQLVLGPSAIASLVVWGVWGVWAVLTVWGFVFVLHYTRNVPVGDDWEMIPYIARKKPLSVHYLWSLHAEHRIPLPRLVTI